MNSRYIELLKKYHSDNSLLELLDLVVLDSMREREDYYLKNKKYPDNRCLLSKLKVDLQTVRAYVDMKK